MMRNVLITTAIVLLGASVSSCGGGKGKGVDVGVTPPVAAPFENQFGASGFGPGFRAGANTDPRDVAPGDVIPVSLTAEPVTLPGA